MKFSLFIPLILSKMGAYAPFFGLIPSADSLVRQDGISALVIVRNEPWLEPSLLSIKDLVDEFVIVDSSTKDISDSIKKLINAGLNIRYVHTESNYTQQLNKAISLSTRRWLLRWDADFIAYTSGKRNILQLKNILNSVNSKKYFAFWLKLANVDVDLFHTEKGKQFHTEPYLFSYSPVLHKGKSFIFQFFLNCFCKLRGFKPSRIPFMPFPLWYETRNLTDVFILHLKTVKPIQRLIERPSQSVWALASESIKDQYGNSFDNFVKQGYNEEKGKRFIAGICANLIPFEKDIFGYPDTLKQWIKNKFKMDLAPTDSFNNKLKNFLDGYEAEARKQHAK